MRVLGVAGGQLQALALRFSTKKSKNQRKLVFLFLGEWTEIEMSERPRLWENLPGRQILGRPIPAASTILDDSPQRGGEIQRFRVLKLNPSVLQLRVGLDYFREFDF